MDRQALTGLARALAGALLFSLPMLMTMELWSIGFYIAPIKLVLLLALTLPLLIGLSWLRGFEPTSTLADDIVDALVAFAVGVLAAVIVLALFGLLSSETSVREAIGKIALQAVPGSLGAILARSQLGGNIDRKKRERAASYPAVLLMMAAGALFLGLNVAPTEEVIALAYSIGVWRTIALALFSLAVMHAFVYVVGFRGTPEPAPDATFLGQFIQFTLVGYAIVLVLSLYLLWTFGRTEATGIDEIIKSCIVLGFPGALGAAASRLIL